MPGMAQPPAPEENDKSVQNAVDKDNYRTAHTRAVKPSMIAPITGETVILSYTQRLHYGYSRAASLLVDHKPNKVQWPLRELPNNIINSIGSKTRVRLMGYSWNLCMSSFGF